ncbi:Uma2 family endonuclease [Hydrogenimonas cancrithermarum]|uniref:Putative restriction endonuclease domain-containing protein n=1 Tax=Hydrogenimonas cancrithermarum TaxID=2993563 RepID=A0ABN6WYT2_9BACT|nr:Uma2 family endonuclease [Hydrogenimonas cancrithermarum]BDY13425.1 hypothetical protein HCR_17370 [Hydrogenimonas cancrithermarum]
MAALKWEDLPHYTYEDYKQWEGDWELIGGVAYAMAPAPVKIHQKLMGDIYSQIREKLLACENCEVLFEEDWKVSEDTVFRPDVAVVCNDDNENFITKTPEVIFEILSPSTARRDEGLKFEMYAAEGVKYYVLVYPNELVAKVYRNGGEGFRKVGDFRRETVSFERLVCDFAFDFDALFSRFR